MGSTNASNRGIKLMVFLMNVSVCGELEHDSLTVEKRKDET